MSFASGGCAGFLVKTMTAPLSRMTILLQVDAVGAGAGGVHGVSKQLTAMDVFRQVRATEGLSSFWKVGGGSSREFDVFRDGVRVVWEGDLMWGRVGRGERVCAAGFEDEYWVVLPGRY